MFSYIRYKNKYDYYYQVVICKLVTMFAASKWNFFRISIIRFKQYLLLSWLNSPQWWWTLSHSPAVNTITWESSWYLFCFSAGLVWEVSGPCEQVRPSLTSQILCCWPQTAVKDYRRSLWRWTWSTTALTIRLTKPAACTYWKHSRSVLVKYRVT